MDRNNIKLYSEPDKFIVLDDPNPLLACISKPFKPGSPVHLELSSPHSSS